MKQHLLAAALVGATSFAANASTLNVTYQDDGTAFGSEGLRQVVKIGSDDPGLGLYEGLVYAGEFKLNEATTLGNFAAFCIDLMQTLKNPDVYTLKNDLLSSDVVSNIDKLFTSAYATVTTSLNAAAFQVALWEIVYDTGTAGGFDLDSGNFLTMLTDGGVERNEAVEVAAENLLQGLATAQMGGYNLTFLHSEAGQDLVTASPVPLPAAGWMLIAGVGGLVAMRRKRKA